MANLIGNVFSAETLRIAVATRRNGEGYEHKLLKADWNVWDIYEPAVEALKKSNIKSIEGICCYTEPKMSVSEYTFRRFSLFGKTFWHENLSTINN